jgi:hypothetical protein
MDLVVLSLCVRVISSTSGELTMKRIKCFEKAGSENTDDALDLALKTSKTLVSKKAVVARTTGVTAIS